MPPVGCGRPPCQHPGQGCRPDAPQRRTRPPRSRPHTRVFTAHGPCQPPCSALSQGTRCQGPKSKTKRRPRPALKTLRALAEGPGLGASAPAPDRPTFPRCARSYQSAGRTRFALAEAPAQSRLGALLPLSLVGTRSCFCRDRFSQRWGASFSFRRLGAAHHFFSGPRVPAQTFAQSRESSCSIRSGCWGNLRFSGTGAGCERSPENSPRVFQTVDQSQFRPFFSQHANIANSYKGVNQPSCLSLKYRYAEKMFRCL
jgi:hypothetical protein